MQLFYKKDFESIGQLDDVDTRHAIKVLRKNLGDVLHITDGEGYLFEARIHKINTKNIELKIEDKQFFEAPKFELHLAIAPTKNIERIEYVIEKATEIGISKFSFIKTSNSERKHINLERLERIAISAMKQSLKFYLPQLSDIVEFEDFICNVQNEKKIICHYQENALELKTYTNIQDVCVMIGPEGDFSKEEFQLALQKGFEPVNLGDSRLRTETAALVAVTLLNFQK